eukprot:snap_masked-scaffold_3-processed-gene-1.42-mRNA-1 protein AED:1.00 eAED:1.00 QI:0/-1/0/0/-1/1/1/0/132
MYNMELQLKEVCLIDSTNKSILVSLGKLATKGFDFEMNDKKLTIQSGNCNILNIEKKKNNLYRVEGDVNHCQNFWYRFFMHPSEQILNRTLLHYNISKEQQRQHRNCGICNACKDARLPNKSKRKDPATIAN